MNRKIAWVILLSGFMGATAHAQLKINEVFYNTPGSFGGNQFIELHNAGATEIYLDGLIITDEGGSDSEGIFQFPGSGNEHAVLPGASVYIAVDATGVTIGADWECYAGAGDTDNPNVCNVVLVQGSLDLGLSKFGDNVILADGTSTSFPISLPINTNIIIDGMNYSGFLGPGGGELAPIGPGIPETDGSITSAVGSALARSPAGFDTDTSTTADFVTAFPTPSGSGSCSNGMLPVVFQFISTGGGHITNTWRTTAGETYRLQYSTNLFDGTNWVAIGSDTVATTNSVTKVDTDATSDVHRAYRVLQLP